MDKSRFIEMFGPFEAKKCRWSTMRLGDLGNFKNGMNYRNGNSGIEFHCLGVADFKNLSIIDNTSNLSTIFLDSHPSNEYFLRNGDIVFVRSNGNKELVGRCLAVYPNEVPTIYSGFCIRFRLENDKVELPYLLQILKSDYMRIKMRGRGANIQNLNQSILSSLVIPIPPLSFQRQFKLFAQQSDKSKMAVQIMIYSHFG